MNNEVEVHVVADDDVRPGFDRARHESKKLGDDIADDMKKAGPKAGADLSEGLFDGLKKDLPSFAQFGGVVGAIMAPTLGAAVAAGVMGAAGGAGIIGGLALAAKDPAVQAAFADLKRTAGEDLKQAASSFVPVALTSIHKVQGAFKSILPDLKSIFDKSSTFVDPLLSGILDGGKHIIGSVKNLVDGAKPVFEAFGRSFDQIGISVGDVFNSLADNGKEGASAVDDLTNSMANFIKVTGTVINGLAEFKGKEDDLDSHIDKTRYKLEDHVSWLDLTADGYKKGSAAAELYRQGLIGVSGSANDYDHYLAKQKAATDAVTGSTKKQLSAVQALASALTAQTDPLFAVIDAQSQLNSATKNYSDAVRKHGRSSQEARDADIELDKATVGLVGSMGAAAGSTGHLTAQQKALLASAGASKSRIKELDTTLYNAWKQAQKLDGLNVDIDVKYHRSVDGPEVLNASGHRIGGYAHGGVVGAASGATSSGRTWTGERGPELLDLPPGTTVHTAGDSARMAQQSAGGGTTHVVLSFDKAGITGLARSLMETIRAEVRASGGSVQQTLGVPGVA